MSTVQNCDIMPHQPEIIISHKVKQKTSDLDAFVDLSKRKIRLPSPREKIQLLFLAPSQKTKETMRTFQVSNYSVRQAKKFLQLEGLLALTPPRRGKKLQQEAEDCIVNFNERGDYSRILPSKKGKVSVSKNISKQKRLK